MCDVYALDHITIIMKEPYGHSQRSFLGNRIVLVPLTLH